MASSSSRRTNFLDASSFMSGTKFHQAPHRKDLDHFQHLHKPQALLWFAWPFRKSSRQRASQARLPFFVLFSRVDLAKARPRRHQHRFTYMHPHHTGACVQYEDIPAIPAPCMPLRIARPAPAVLQPPEDHQHTKEASTAAPERTARSSYYTT